LKMERTNPLPLVPVQQLSKTVKSATAPATLTSQDKPVRTRRQERNIYETIPNQLSPDRHLLHHPGPAHHHHYPGVCASQPITASEPSSPGILRLPVYSVSYPGVCASQPITASEPSSPGILRLPVYSVSYPGVKLIPDQLPPVDPPRTTWATNNTCHLVRSLLLGSRSPPVIVSKPVESFSWDLHTCHLPKSQSSLLLVSKLSTCLLLRMRRIYMFKRVTI
jgi:hypothetical protein